MNYVHVYRSTEKGLRAIGSTDRAWHGRRRCLLRSFMIWEDGHLTEVPALCDEATEPEAETAQDGLFA
jgi:hypothetical protein